MSHHTCRTLVFLLLPALASCQLLQSDADRALSVCEDVITKDLRSPSTYKRVDTVIEPHEIGTDVRSVHITYDAANAFGTPVRGTGGCAFEVAPDTGEFPSKIELETQAIRAGNHILRHQLEVDAGRAKPDPYEGLLTCCLSRELRQRELARIGDVGEERDAGAPRP